MPDVRLRQGRYAVVWAAYQNNELIRARAAADIAAGGGVDPGSEYILTADVDNGEASILTATLDDGDYILVGTLT